MAQTVFAPWEDPEQRPLIEFRNVTKRFGDFTAIDDLSLGATVGVSVRASFAATRYAVAVGHPREDKQTPSRCCGARRGRTVHRARALRRAPAH